MYSHTHYIYSSYTHYMYYHTLHVLKAWSSLHYMQSICEATYTACTEYMNLSTLNTPITTNICIYVLYIHFKYVHIQHVYHIAHTTLYIRTYVLYICYKHICTVYVKLSTLHTPNTTEFFDTFGLPPPPPPLGIPLSPPHPKTKSILGTRTCVEYLCGE